MGNDINKVLPGLYVGGILGTNRQQLLSEKKITHVLSILDSRIEDKDFTHKFIKASDSVTEDLKRFFPECVDFIHECRCGGGSVYVHCAAGISRSSTMVIAYLMTVSTLTAEEALCVVRYCRKIANPNYGFMKQLKEYEETTLARERVRVRAKGCVQEDEEQLRALLSEAKRPVTK